jgi:hypothetical protein
VIEQEGCELRVVKLFELLECFSAHLSFDYQWFVSDCVMTNPLHLRAQSLADKSDILPASSLPGLVEDAARCLQSALDRDSSLIAKFGAYAKVDSYSAMLPLLVSAEQSVEVFAALKKVAIGLRTCDLAQVWLFYVLHQLCLLVVVHSSCSFCVPVWLLVEDSIS